MGLDTPDYALIRIAAEIRAYLKDTGYKTLSQAAEKIGMTPSNFSSQLSGKKHFSSKIATKLYNAFGIYPEFVLTGRGPIGKVAKLRQSSKLSPYVRKYYRIIDFLYECLHGTGVLSKKEIPSDILKEINQYDTDFSLALYLSESFNKLSECNPLAQEQIIDLTETRREEYLTICELKLLHKTIDLNLENATNRNDEYCDKDCDR